MIERAEKEKFDIIVLAGQSNAEGNGLCAPNRVYHNEKVFQMTDESLVMYDYASIEYESRVAFPIDYAGLRRVNYRILSDISEPFVEEYIKDGFLSSDRKILIIKAAVGGTGFALKQWGVGNPLHKRLCDMIEYARSLNSENRFVAFLWHQGEHDAFEQPQLGFEERKAFYYDNFKATAEDIRKRCGANDLPIIAGEFADSWADENKSAADAVEEATAKVCRDIGFAKVASSKGLLSNAQVMEYSGDNIHFCDESITELALRYYEKYKTIIGR